METLLPLLVAALVVLFLIFSSIKVLNEWERAVVLRLGRVLGNDKGPGLIILIPIIDKMQKVDTRTVTLQVPPQEIITRDNVSTRVTAVAYFRVVDPLRAITQVADFMYATSQIAQTTLRSALGQHSLDELLSEREKINDQLQTVIDAQTEPWGIKVSVVEIKDVEIPANMQRAMAKEAEAERERRAKIINAEGEFQASQQLTNAANIMATNPITLQLRYLQTMLEIGASSNTTTLLPIPMDLVHSMRALTPPIAPSSSMGPPAT